MINNYDPLHDCRTHFPGGPLSFKLNWQRKGKKKYEMLANDLLRNCRSSNTNNIERAIISHTNNDTA